MNSVPTSVGTLPSPYLLFLGNVVEPGFAKTAFGLRDWAGDRCVGEFALAGAQVTTGLRRMHPAAAAAAGARAMVIGVANPGGVIPSCWLAALHDALEAGLDLVSGMHVRLANLSGLDAAAARLGRRLFDVRVPPTGLSVGTGVRRTGKRLLTVTSEDPHLGTFVNQTTGKPMRLTEVDGRLKPEDGPSLQDMGDGRFCADHTEIAFTDGDRYDYINPDGQRTAFVRAVPFTPDPAMLAGYAGRYASDEAEAVYDVTAEETGLRLTLVSRPKLNVLTKPAYPDAFTHGDTLLRFRRDAGGKITAMSFGIARVRDLTFARSSRSLRP